MQLHTHTRFKLPASHHVMPPCHHDTELPSCGQTCLLHKAVAPLLTWSYFCPDGLITVVLPASDPNGPWHIRAEETEIKEPQKPFTFYKHMWEPLCTTPTDQNALWPRLAASISPGLSMHFCRVSPLGLSAPYAHPSGLWPWGRLLPTPPPQLSKADPVLDPSSTAEQDFFYQ